MLMLTSTSGWILTAVALLIVALSAGNRARGQAAVGNEPPPAAPPLPAPVADLTPPKTAESVVALAPGVFRCDADRAARDAAKPSLSFASPVARDAIPGERRTLPGGPLPRELTPRFTKDQNGRHVVTLPLPEGTNLYGTGEIAGPLERTGKRTATWNTDAFAYDDRTATLYQSHPWVLAVMADGSSLGVLADTSYRCEIDLRSGIRFVADGPPFPAIVFRGDSPQEVITRLTALIGRIELPPKWALGYHQCRYSYYPASRVMEIARGFRDRDIPCDVIWHDIDYMDRFRVFTFDSRHFPDPKAHNAQLHELNFRTVWMIDPGVAAQRGYGVYDDLMERGLYVKTASGEPFIGDVWPGPCVFPDFTRQETRAWWAGLYKEFLATGIDGVWNDMNEPAVFKTPTKTMPLDNQHAADPELGGPGPHAQYHNVYGMLMARGTWEGMRTARPDRRPFVLTRANFIGGHRYAATWTGDNVANWDHLRWSVTMALSLGLSGQPFAGPDIGGFKGAGDAQLFARWMGVGAMLPFARGHTETGQRDKEPWSFGADTERACRFALQRRYELMPYLYTLFWEASQTGLPVVRPLFFADPKDPKLRTEDEAFLLGGDVLVAPAVSRDGGRAATRPNGIWRTLRLSGAGHPELPDLYVRGGAIVPVGPVMEFVDEEPLDPLTLIVCPDARGRATGTLYEDAGDGYGYRADDYRLTHFEARRAGSTLRVKVASVTGKRPAPERALHVRVILDKQEVVAWGREGEEIEIRLPSER
jgi:alpha-glucosidase (family GH31 glycosyl hydrolase)